VALLLCGCTTVKAGDHGRSLWLVGLVHVVLPESRGKVEAVDVKTVGAGWDAGPYLGWKAGNWIISDPADCQLLIVIRSQAQAENAVKVLQSFGGRQPCIIDYTQSLRR